VIFYDLTRFTCRIALRIALRGAQVTFSERHVNADGFTVRVLEAGSGAPVVYLHGAGGLHLTKAHELLAQRYRVVALEIPGFGADTENSRTTSFEELATTMARAVEAAGVRGGYTLVGTSFGGTTALHMALADPDPAGDEAAAGIEALVLISPAAFHPEGWQRPAPADMARALFVRPENVPPRDPPPPGQVAFLQRLRGSIDQAALRARLAEVRIPTLVLCGTEDGVLPPEMGRIYRAQMPNCTLLYVWDAAHELTSDRPEALAAVIADFADRREAFIVGVGD